MEVKRRQPLGIELVRRNIVTEDDVRNALEIQRKESNKKIGDILNEMNVCDPKILIEAIGEIIGEKGILLHNGDISIQIEDYISLDIARQCKCVPFDISQGKIKVCFADTVNKRNFEKIRLLLLNKGLVIDKYITFESNINNILDSLHGIADENININADITNLVDSVIKTAIEKRASDIHFEPMENELRIRYRIDGELFTAANIQKEKQDQIVGRLKAISNMHQEKQEPQDGRILLYPEFNIRVSSQKNIYGEKFVLRLLRKNQNIKSLNELGFPENEDVNSCFNKRNSITIMAAPTGEGKTTSLYSIVNYLNKPEVNITTIEDPVEIRIKGVNQIEVDPKVSFSSSLRTILRQDPDIILVGEIRDKETAEISMQAGQTGHYVLSTIHTIDAIEVITRLRKMGISNYDISSTVATTVSQRLVRRVCPRCAKERDFTQEEIKIIEEIGNKYNVKFDLTGKKTYEIIGCPYCNNIGYRDRIGIFEILKIDDTIRELISNDESPQKIKSAALISGYKPLIVDGIQKVLDGVTTLEELNRKLLIL